MESAFRCRRRPRRRPCPSDFQFAPSSSPPYYLSSASPSSPRCFPLPPPPQSAAPEDDDSLQSYLSDVVDDDLHSHPPAAHFHELQESVHSHHPLPHNHPNSPAFPRARRRRRRKNTIISPSSITKQPRIIHTRDPLPIIVNQSEFKRIVQTLTSASLSPSPSPSPSPSTSTSSPPSPLALESAHCCPITSTPADSVCRLPQRLRSSADDNASPDGGRVLGSTANPQQRQQQHPDKDSENEEEETEARGVLEYEWPDEEDPELGWMRGAGSYGGGGAEQGEGWPELESLEFWSRSEEENIMYNTTISLVEVDNCRRSIHYHQCLLFQQPCSCLPAAEQNEAASHGTLQLDQDVVELRS